MTPALYTLVFLMCLFTVQVNSVPNTAACEAKGGYCVDSRLARCAGLDFTLCGPEPFAACCPINIG